MCCRRPCICCCCRTYCPCSPGHHPSSSTLMAFEPSSHATASDSLSSGLSTESRAEILIVGIASIAVGALSALLSALLPLPFFVVVAVTCCAFFLASATQHSTLWFGGLAALGIVLLIMRHPYAFSFGWSVALGCLLFADSRSRARLTGATVGAYTSASLLSAVGCVACSGVKSAVQAARLRFAPAEALVHIELLSGWRASCDAACEKIRARLPKSISDLLFSSRYTIRHSVSPALTTNDLAPEQTAGEKGESPVSPVIAREPLIKQGRTKKAGSSSSDEALASGDKPLSCLQSIDEQ